MHCCKCLRLRKAKHYNKQLPGLPVTRAVRAYAETVALATNLLFYVSMGKQWESKNRDVTQMTHLLQSTSPSLIKSR